jgi:hypothetical protein
VQIECNVEASAPQPSRHDDVVGEPLETRSLRGGPDLVEVRVAAYDWLGQGFDEICEMGAWKSSPQPSQDRRREDDVAYEAEADEENFHRRSTTRARWWLRR